MQTLRQLTDKELDTVCGGHGGFNLNFQTNKSHNTAVTVLSKDVNIIQGSNINGGVVQIA
jgi:hypothetical protein